MEKPEQNPADTASSESEMPTGMRYGYQFAFYNAINFQIATGTPLVLFAKQLGASSTVLGILTSLLPLFAFLQLPAASFLPRFGYKKFMLLGWGLRTIMVFALSAVPILIFIDSATKMALTLILLVIFSVLRGISVGVWFPWITELLPVRSRGHYLSREQLAVHSASLFALGVSAITLQFLPDPWRYSAIFLLAAIAGVTSLFALQKMPDAPATEDAKQSSHPVPWRAIVAYKPFRKLLLFGALWSVGVSGMGTFTTAFTRESLKFHDSTIVYLSLFSFIGALATLPFMARFLEGAGITNALRTTTFCTGAVVLGWMLLASRIWPPTWWAVALLNLVFGMATANFSVANSSLAMGVMPVMGRTHFFSLYTVCTSVIYALSPILFGILLDAFKNLSLHFGEWSVNRYSLYFLVAMLVLILTTLLVSLLRTHEIGELNRRDFTIIASLRRFGRLLQR